MEAGDLVLLGQQQIGVSANAAGLILFANWSDAVNPPSEVPIPGALWLMLSGLESSPMHRLPTAQATR